MSLEESAYVAYLEDVVLSLLVERATLDTFYGVRSGDTHAVEDVVAAIERAYEERSCQLKVFSYDAIDQYGFELEWRCFVVTDDEHELLDRTVKENEVVLIGETEQGGSMVRPITGLLSVITRELGPIY